MQQNHNTDDTTQSKSKGRTGVLEQDEPRSSPNNQPYSRERSRNAVEEARQLLDEIAGVSPENSQRRKPRLDVAHTVKTILLWPFIVIWAILKLIVSPLRRADFRLISEMQKFLKHPGHFFWFNRIAPEAAARHFGTSSTDAMTHHARRYAAHIAMLILAVVVVLFGGFSGLTVQLKSMYANIDSPQMNQGYMIVTGEGRELYASAVAANTTAFPRRITTLTVKEGESLRSIAAGKQISLETLLFANNFVDPDTELKAGQNLVIPPVSGILHITNPGDTVGKVADLYGVDVKVILDYDFNNLQEADSTTVLKPLQEIMIPGAVAPIRNAIFMYAIKSEDTLTSISSKFGISVDTILENNDLEDGLTPGVQIRILPVDGLIYTVKRGDTLAGVANYLDTSEQNIVNFKGNNVARGVALQTGQSLIVPGGVWPPPPPPPPPPAAPVEARVPAPTPVPVKTKPSAVIPASKNTGKVAPAVAPLPKRTVAPVATTAPKVAVAAPKATVAPKVAVAPVAKATPKPVVVAPKVVPKPAPVTSAGRATGSMRWPSYGVITTYFGQAIWYGVHKGLDISRGCGSTIVAADGGTVVEAGWSSYGYGISALIDHGGGIKTRYGHFSSIAVYAGQRVSKGQIIGYEGTTGNSSGCHLHFEVIVNGVPRNPLGWLN